MIHEEAKPVEKLGYQRCVCVRFALSIGTIFMGWALVSSEENGTNNIRLDVPSCCSKFLM